MTEPFYSLIEISKFATRIGIIHEGKMLQEVNTDSLANYRNRRLIIRVHDNQRATSILAEKGIGATILEDGLLEITDKEGIDRSEKINVLLVHAECPPSLIRIDEEDLESYFLRVIENAGGEK